MMDEEEGPTNLYEVVGSGGGVATPPYRQQHDDGAAEKKGGEEERAEEDATTTTTYEVVVSKEGGARNTSSSSSSSDGEVSRMLDQRRASRPRKLDVGRELYWNHHFQVPPPPAHLAMEGLLWGGGGERLLGVVPPVVVRWWVVVGYEQSNVDVRTYVGGGWWVVGGGWCSNGGVCDVQEALCMEDSIQKFSRLSHIANDFQLAAKTYAQIIGTPSLRLKSAPLTPECVHFFVHSARSLHSSLHSQSPS
jgi:hypothetical protein